MKLVNRNLINSKNRPGSQKNINNQIGIVIHFTGALNQTAEQCRNFIQSRTDWGSYNYIIDFDGSILELIPPSEVAYANGHILPPTHPSNRIFNANQLGQGSQNWATISICMTIKSWSGPYEDEQIKSLIDLIGSLKSQFPNLKWLLTHNDINGKACDGYFRLNKSELTKIATLHNMETI